MVTNPTRARSEKVETGFPKRSCSCSVMVESGSMHIVCPYCTTSYALNPASLGAAGRNVRCARCKEVWLARPEDAFEPTPAMAMDGPAQHAGDSWNNATGEDGDHE